MLNTSALCRSVSAATLALLGTIATIGTAITPAPLEARSNAPFYTAELAAPAKEARPVISGVVWYCEGTRCVAGKGTSRPVIVCARVASALGEVTSFTAKGKALDAAKLERCND